MERAITSVEYDPNPADLENSILGIKGTFFYWSDDPGLPTGGHATFQGPWTTTVSLGDSQATIEAAAQVAALAAITAAWGGFTTVGLVSTDLGVIAPTFTI